MSEIDIVREASRLLGPLMLAFLGLYEWKKLKWARLGGYSFLALAFVFIGAELAGLEVVVRTGIPDRALDAAVWLLLAVALWFIANAAFERKWGEGET